MSDDRQNSGASVPDQALVSDQAAARLDPSGFDPSRDLPQVVAQCRAVAHMATALAQVFAAKADAFEQGAWPTIWGMTGAHSAALMETLGDILNNMDAVDEGEDAWLTPVFGRAHELFPRDSDEHPKGEDAARLSGEAMPARAEGIAHSTPESSHVSTTPRDVIARIAAVSSAVGFQAGVGAMETAGSIVSYLAAHPEEIDAFMAGGSVLDWPVGWHTEGCLSWHGMDGSNFEGGSPST